MTSAPSGQGPRTCPAHPPRLALKSRLLLALAAVTCAAAWGVDEGAFEAAGTVIRSRFLLDGTMAESAGVGGNVRIRDETALKAKLDRIRQAGPEHLHIISDFDYTMTSFMHNGKRAASTHRVLEVSPLLGEDFRQKTNALFHHYYPIEISDMPHAEKEEKMIEWWTKAHELMETYGLNRAHLAEMVAEKDALVLREGTMQLLEMAHTHSIPFHVFSAGIYDVIHAFFEHTQAYVYNPHVVSNMMAFDAEGNLTGFKGNLVHTLNKNSRVIQNSDSWPRVRDRTNVLLLGDNINDVQMADGLNITDIVNIGFLNDRVERLPQYMERYDIVLLGDPDMSYVNNLLASLLPSPPPPGDAAEVK